MSLTLVAYARVKRSWTAGKTPVFRLLKRHSKVFTVSTPNAQNSTLMPFIREEVKPGRIVYTDIFKSYNALDVSELFAKGYNPINVIENFGNQDKRH